MPDTQRFLDSIWPSDSLYCLMLYPLNGGRPHHKVFRSKADVFTFIDRNKRQFDIYHTVHTLAHTRIWNDLKRGRLPDDAPPGKTQGGWSVRTSANMASAQALYLDLDVGKADGYTSQREAVDDLRRFCGDVGLPKPTIVSSGYGVHAYWTLTEPVDSHVVWAPMAQMLKTLTAALELRVDTEVTADVARILRPVGSINHKRGGSEPVRLLTSGAPTTPDDMNALLEAACVANQASVIPGGAGGAIPGVQASVGQDASSIVAQPYDGPLSPLEDVLSACGQIKRMADDPAHVSEPEWYAMLGVVVHTREGLAAAHTVSQGHPGYDHDETQIKAERAAALPPTGCAKLRSASGVHASICDGCPFWSKVKGPMAASRLAAAPAPSPKAQFVLDDVVVEEIAIPDPPKPFRRMRDGWIGIDTEDKNGSLKVVPVLLGDLYPVRRMRETDGPDTIQWRYHAKNGEGMRTFKMTGSEFVADKTLDGIVADNGIYVEDPKRLRHYMSFYLRHLASRHKADELHGALGWTDGYENFVMGDRMLTPAGVKPALLTPDAINVAKALRTGGTLQGQVDALKFYDDHRYVGRQIYIVASLATPWLYITRQLGLVINAVGPGGTSKSTTLRAAASIWGSPADFVHSGLSHSHTRRGVELYASALSNLPICLDEISLMGDMEARAFVMGASQKGAGPKGARHGGLQDLATSRKHSIYMTNSNRSLIDMTGGQDDDIAAAAAMRVLEFQFERTSVHSKAEADTFINDIMTHYGHIGPAMMKELVPRREQVERAILKRMAEIDAKLGLTSQERFRSAGFAASLTMMDLAKAMGLISWSSKNALAFLAGHQLDVMRDTDNRIAHQSDPVTVLTDFIQANHGGMLVVQSGQLGASWMELEPSHRLTIHFDASALKMWVSRTQLRDYCQRRGVSPNALIADLIQRKVVLDENARFALGAGTKHMTARGRCILIDVAHPDLAAAAASTVQQAQAGNVIPMAARKP